MNKVTMMAVGLKGLAKLWMMRPFNNRNMSHDMPSVAYGHRPMWPLNSQKKTRLNMRRQNRI